VLEDLTFLRIIDRFATLRHFELDFAGDTVIKDIWLQSVFIICDLCGTQKAKQLIISNILHFY